ncbi:MAG: type II toxin-antitoxin system VapC family toxin [Bacteroidales bacterium]|jgi:predicted nucleic acid-binding protein|nr:type II toxin-antitoxin system VapC family toxin [Bacteroidales bacterium]NCU34507.1 PIN domain-containing protein [Candidatus Falkowbacteria bacterium]MDD2631684.1 type II toxin-antitoxin system VapC family toxin [Bacteroidales bacterium]MDD3132646.1 type II toxin-antitoxin system VapC family toxin [Bacteroidales bacterium]MDD3526867.1 type II toxin-antitoxin system VapC family toxin [Bacteroidales bacterium]
MNSILLDTNVLIYAFDESSEFHQKSVELFESEENNLFVTTKNISEFFAVCSKLNFDLNKTLGFYADIKENFEILKPSEYSLTIFESLIRKYNPRGNRVYDIEIVSVMLTNGLTKVATANFGDFSNIDEIEVVAVKFNPS